jgi:hypothetical protein
MKRLWAMMALLLMGITVQAQDQGFESYIYQANGLCEFRITVQAETNDAPIIYRLSYYETVYGEGALTAGDEVNLYLPLTDQWYILIVEREAGDVGAYSVDTGLACEGRIEGGDRPPAPSPEFMAIWDAIREDMIVIVEALFAP